MAAEAAVGCLVIRSLARLSQEPRSLRIRLSLPIDRLFCALAMFQPAASSQVWCIPSLVPPESCAVAKSADVTILCCHGRSMHDIPTAYCINHPTDGPHYCHGDLHGEGGFELSTRNAKE